MIIWNDLTQIKYRRWITPSAAFVVHLYRPISVCDHCMLSAAPDTIIKDGSLTAGQTQCHRDLPLQFLSDRVL
jgi:hypothetical protein